MKFIVPFVLIVLSLLPFQSLPGQEAVEGQGIESQDIPSPQRPADSQSWIIYLPFSVKNKYFPAPSAFGLETWSYQPNTTGTILFNQGAFHWIRRNGLLWSDVEASQGTYNWGADRVVSLEKDMLNAAGMAKQMILIVRSTPTWAQQVPGKACGPIQQEAIDDFADFMADVVQRYSLPPYNVLYYEIGNEIEAPTAGIPGDEIYGCWGDPNDPYFGGRYYADVLKQIYPKMKSVNPNVQVLLGGLLMDCDPVNPPAGKDCTISKYLEGILVNGGRDYFDAVSFHSYDYYEGGIGRYSNGNWYSAWNTTGPTVTAKIGYIRNLLSQYSASDKPIYLTEVALLCQDAYRSDCGSANFQRTKAHYIAQAYAVAIEQKVQAAIWYHQYDMWNHTGLMDVDDDPVYEAFYAGKFASKQVGAVRGAQNRSDASFFIYDLDSTNGPLWLVWSKDGRTRDLTLNSTPAAAFDVFGNPVQVSARMEIGTAPIYIRWEAP
jgi:hypothetical protein